MAEGIDMNLFPPGFECQSIEISLGKMAYCTSTTPPWGNFDPRSKPPLIFLHSVGGGSSAYEWSKVYPAFNSDYRIIAPDLIGWGASAHPVKDYQVSDYGQMISELIHQLTTPPVAVVASSLTAGMTIRLAIERPELFRALLLVCPTGFADFGIDYARGLAAQVAGIGGVDRLIYALGAANEFAVRTFLEQVLFAQPDRVTAEMVAAYLASATQANAEYTALSSLRGDLCFDLALYLPQLTVPTVILWGEQDRFTGVKVGQRLAKLNPQAVKHFCPIPDTGVLAHLEQPAIVIGLIQKYFLPLLSH